MTTETKSITITLSDRAPVKINPELWPCIARATWHDGQVQVQANHEAFIRVRQHDDGRTLVYCSLHAGNGGVHAGWRGAAGGFLLEDPHDPVPSDDIVRAIRRCAGIISMPELGDECIADLPAEEI